jgi:multiple RNA-binding domain-containing protein 1
VTRSQPLAENPLKRKRDSNTQPKNDEKLKQFLGVMQATAKTRTWQNEATDGAEATVSAIVEAEDSSDDDIQILKSSKKGKPQTEQLPEGDLDMVDAGASEEAVATKATLKAKSDKDWLRSKAGTLLEDNEEEELGSAPEETIESKEPPGTDYPPPGEELDTTEEPVEEEQDKNSNDTVEKIKQHGRLYLRNLPFTATEEDLRDKFGAYGELEEVRSDSFSLFTLCLAFYDEIP